MVYDSRRDRMILLGGNELSRTNLWAMSLASGGRWTPLTVGGGAPASGPAGAVYDTAGDRVLVIAPAAVSSGREEVWALPLGGASSWVRLATTGTPPANDGCVGLALDDSGRRLFAIVPRGASASGEVWALDLATLAWGGRVASGPAEGICHDGSAIYDGVRDRIVTLSSSSVWAYTLSVSSGWSQLASFKTGSGHDRLALDRAGDAALVLEPSGGVFSIPLAGGPQNTLNCSECGSNDRTGFAAAYDARRRRIVANGGWDELIWRTSSATLAIDLAKPAGWAPIGASSGGARIWQTAVADPAHGRLVVYGGDYDRHLDPGGTVLTRPMGDLHAGATSVATLGASRPRFYYGHSMTSDPGRGRILFYGGQAADGTGEFLSGLWALSTGDAPEWTRLSPGGTGPGPRMWHAAWLDPVRDRLIVLGGSSPASSATHAWELTFAPALTWRPLVVAGDHDGSRITRAFPDPSTGEAWAWGTGPGDLYRVALGPDTLELERLPLAGSPEAWWQLDPLVFDASRHRLVVFEADFSDRDQTSGFWSVQLGGAASWAWKSTGATRPRDRYLFSAVHDPVRDRVILYGGYDDNSHYFDDWWSLEWDRPTMTAVSLASARMEGGMAHLVWQFGEAADASVDVERSRGGGLWTTLVSRQPDLQGRVAYDDSDLAPGARYGYRLTLRNAGGTASFGETWLDVPEAATFALRGALANPVAGDLVVGFSLDRASDATLGLFDLGGRRLAERLIHAEAAGPREVMLARRGEFPPGVYFLRLDDGARSSAARVVLAQ